MQRLGNICQNFPKILPRCNIWEEYSKILSKYCLDATFAKYFPKFFKNIAPMQYLGNIFQNYLKILPRCNVWKIFAKIL